MSAPAGSTSEAAAVLLSRLPDVLAFTGENASMPHADLARRLRERFPGNHFTVCGENELSPRLKAVAENDAAALYLLASGGHCPTFTDDPAAATGLVVAMRADD